MHSKTENKLSIKCDHFTATNQNHRNHMKTRHDIDIQTKKEAMADRIAKSVHPSKEPVVQTAKSVPFLASSNKTWKSTSQQFNRIIVQFLTYHSYQDRDTEKRICVLQYRDM